MSLWFRIFKYVMKLNQFNWKHPAIDWENWWLPNLLFLFFQTQLKDKLNISELAPWKSIDKSKFKSSEENINVIYTFLEM